MVLKKKIKKPIKLYKHSFGHYKDEYEAEIALKQFQKKFPNKKLEVCIEKRSKKRWKHYCVCEYYPEKGKHGKKTEEQKRSKKSTVREVSKNHKQEGS